MCDVMLRLSFILYFISARSVVSRVIDTVSNENVSELKLVHVIFRHGERTPTDTYPKDIYVNHTLYPYGWGQLTNVGKRNMYQNGQFLRQRFDKFLGQIYSPSMVYAQSTSTDRSLSSCALVLAGLFPPNGTVLEWNSRLNWIPIPIRSEPLDEDTLLLARKNCSRYFEELKDVYDKPEIKEILNENEKLFEKLTEVTGNTIQTPEDVQSLYMTLDTQLRYGLDLPDWTKDFFPDRLLNLTKESYIINAYNVELKRLKGGPVIKKLLQDWNLVINNKMNPRDRKMFVYSGHDSTITNVLLALGVWERQVPNYGIMIIFELFQDKHSQEYGVEIHLRNSTTETPYALTIPGCETRCPISKFIELTHNVVPVDWAEECKAKNPGYVPPALGEP